MPLKSTEDYERKRNRQVAGMKSMLDYVMGLIILLIGLFLFFRNMAELPLNKRFPPDYLDKVFGTVCVVYGGWRIYRGYKKNYFK